MDNRITGVITSNRVAANQGLFDRCREQGLSLAISGRDSRCEDDFSTSIRNKPQSPSAKVNFRLPGDSGAGLERLSEYGRLISLPAYSFTCANGICENNCRSIIMFSRRSN